MKIKLISMAALAVCGSSAFAASECTSITTAVDLVNKCAPEVTVYMAGASAQAPALKTILLTTAAVFDITKPLAYITNTAAGTLAAGDIGAKNTVIYYGYNNATPAKRVAVVYNTANGSFAGVKQMTEGTGTSFVNSAGTTVPFNEHISQGLLTAAQEKLPTSLGCSTNGTQTGFVSPVAAVVCPVVPFTYTTTVAAGGAKGVQLALADVGPNQASLGVLTAGKWTDAKFPMTVTGMQGFGVMVNQAALTALISREIAGGRMAASCATTTVASTSMTAACQPNLSHADMTALVTGKATGATFGVAATTPIVYYRRVPFSGTQASSNITFAGQAATEGFKAADLISGKLKATGYATLADAGAVTATGDYVNKVDNFTTYSKVGSGDVISGVSAPTIPNVDPTPANTLAFGVVSLEKVYPTDTKNTTWVKLGGISPNFKADGTTLDTKQRVGMQAGYPMQFEMVAIKNKATLDKVPAIKTVVDSIVTALADPTYNLAGIAYIGSTDATKKATYFRGGLGNNYAPLTVAP